MAKLIKHAKVIEDSWTFLPLPHIEEAQRKQAGKVVVFKITGEQTIPAELAGTVEVPAGKVIIPLAIWLAQKEQLSKRVAREEIGVWLEGYELIENLIASISDINKLPVIALNFVKLADGRGYSAANLLRTRYGYRNELRAVGDVQRDQLFYLHRVGFDAFAIRADRNAEEAVASLNDFSQPYQGSVNVTQPLWKRTQRGGQS